MHISFSNNPIDKIEIILLNKYENWTQKYWLSKPHHVQCKLCNKKIRSDKDEFSPEQMGWRYLKQTNDLIHWKWGWICHSCDGHFYEHWERKKI